MLHDSGFRRQHSGPYKHSQKNRSDSYVLGYEDGIRRVVYRRDGSGEEKEGTWKSILEGLAPWRSGIAPESIRGVYGHNAMRSDPSASPPV